MGLKPFTINFNILSTSKHCRLDQKYARFTHIDDWIVFKSKYPQKNLSHFLEEIKICKFKKGELDNEYYLVNISDQQQRSGELENIEEVNTIGSDKNFLGDADIFVSKLGMTRGYIFINTYKNRNILGSTEFIPFKMKNEIFKIYLKYILLHPRILKAYSNLESGKTPSHRRVNPYEFLKIKIPLIPQSTSDQIVAQIKPIEKKIKELKVQIKEQKEIINKVFIREFGLDLKSAEENKRKMIHFCSLVDVANEELKFDISLKYRFIFQNYVQKTSKNEWVILGKIADVKGGKRLPKGHNITEEDTGFKYVRVDDLSWSGIFDVENIKYITEETQMKIKNYIAKENDILLTIVGATVGKCGLVPNELDNVNITENFARIIIKDKNCYAPEYINYCLQSKTSVYQVDEYKGRNSQGKLALFRVNKIKIPDINKTQQQKIVDEIKDELDKQEDLKKKIETERKKIYDIIENVIK